MKSNEIFVRPQIGTSSDTVTCTLHPVLRHTWGGYAFALARLAKALDNNLFMPF